MDTLDNIRTFLATVRSGSFSAAARDLGTVPSVVTKRINRLEDQLKATLFVRSTRKLVLTDTGERYYPRFLTVIAEVDDAFRDVARSRSRVEGKLRIKCPTTLTVSYFGDVLTAFQVAYPDVQVELVLMDRSVNPVEEGFDVAIGALPSAYANVVDVPLCPMPRMLVATPSYLEKFGVPQHPRDLIEHDCLTFMATGSSWDFKGPTGAINVDVRSKFSVNDSKVLMMAALRDLGIGLVARHIAVPDVMAGRLVEVLPVFPTPDLWVKALVPQLRRNDLAVQAVLEWLKDATQPTTPWDRDVDASAAR